jgi:transcriptional regulator of acetoin/glycerol metabolism
MPMKFLSTERHPDVEGVRAAWGRFVGGDDVGDAVRPYVLRAWRRSRDEGCDAWLGRASRLSEPDTRRLLEEQAPLVSLGGPFLAALSRAAGADRHAAMLADAGGRLLQVVGDPQTLGDEDFPRPGALLSEATSGANGVGTALAEDGYVELVGPEHFIEGFHAFTCQGVPLRAPGGGIAGILSMSVRRLETADRVRDILFCATEAAECELLARWLAAGTRDPDHPILEQLREDMIQRITMARLQLEVAARRIAGGADAKTTIDSATQLTRKFVRQAGIWRRLAVDPAATPHPERLRLDDLTADFVDLMSTEARVAGVRLDWGRVDAVSVCADPQAAARRLLNGFLSALQVTPTGSSLTVKVLQRGAVAEVRLDPPVGPASQVARFRVVA